MNSYFAFNVLYSQKSEKEITINLEELKEELLLLRTNLHDFLDV